MIVRYRPTVSRNRPIFPVAAGNRRVPGMMITMITSILRITEKMTTTITKMTRKNIPISNQDLLRAGFMVEQAKSATARVSIHHFSITGRAESIDASLRLGSLQIYRQSIDVFGKSIDTLRLGLARPAWRTALRAMPSAESLTFPSMFRKNPSTDRCKRQTISPNRPTIVR